MTEYESWEMRLAWQEMWQVRGCPPDEVLEKPVRDAALERHLAVCPFCAERLDASSAGGENGVEPQGVHVLPRGSGPRSMEERPDPGSGNSELDEGDTHPVPQPGQIRSVRRGLGGWGPKDRHYNPPLVLVLSLPEEVPDVVRVAQLHHEPALASEADMQVMPELFAETWNTYALRSEDLHELWAEVPETVLRAVIFSTGRGPAPGGGEVYRWVEAFQRLEMEVGAFFAMQSAHAVLESREPDAFSRILSAFPDGRSLADHLHRRQPSLVLPETSVDPLLSLALAQFPDHELPLAAAGPENRLIVNRARWTPHGLELRSMQAELTFQEISPKGLTVGGILEKPAPPTSELTAWWHVSGSPPVKASEVSYASNQGFFRVHFPGLPRELARTGRLLLLLGDPADPDGPSNDEL